MPWTFLPVRPFVTSVALMLAVLGFLASRTTAIETIRERAFDILLRLEARPPSGGDEVLVVDIDRAAIEQIGPWPWSREQLAKVLASVASVKPKAIGLDILLFGPDERSPANLARRLAETTTEESSVRIARDLAERLPDGDQQLAQVLATASVTLGMALDSEPAKDEPPAIPVLIRGQPDLSRLWQSESVIGPTKVLAASASGHGVLLLEGDADARIRRVPLIIDTAGGLRPGLALDVVRLAQDASSYLIRDRPLMLATGAFDLRLSADGTLRLRPRPEARHAVRTMVVGTLLSDPVSRQRLHGKIVLIGSSAPWLAGLRPVASGGLVPSVQIQADAIEQILARDAPQRPRGLLVLEFMSALAATAAAAFAGLRWTPVRGGMFACALVGGWLLATFLALRIAGLLLDPLLITATTLTGYGIAVLTAATGSRWREAFIRRRFEQHLAPEIVRRIVEQPGLLKLAGETREITALFTDIENFTAMTERADPAELVALLDRYIDGTSRIVVAHGGMVEKIVGDGLHVIFNAPLDLDNHPTRALQCALALQVFTQAHRREPDAARLRLGRTRIGIETGSVIVGDVGGGRRLDYTAHGMAMNTAARLEAANKEIGSAICIGPGAAARMPPGSLRPLGAIAVRGIAAPLMVYEPWSASMSPSDRTIYLDAVQLASRDAKAATSLLAALALRHPGDGVLPRLVERQAHTAKS